VGDCAARGADLFESIAAEIISAMILGGTMAQRCKIEGKYLYFCSYRFFTSMSLVLSNNEIYKSMKFIMFSLVIWLNGLMAIVTHAQLIGFYISIILTRE
jgi:Na+/H+-translocating membrane pyrophosphatase